MILFGLHDLTPSSRSVGKFSFSLNPGPFNIKEHCLIVIIASTGGGSAYATDILAIQVKGQ